MRRRQWQDNDQGSKWMIEGWKKGKVKCVCQWCILLLFLKMRERSVQEVMETLFCMTDWFNSLSNECVDDEWWLPLSLFQKLGDDLLFVVKHLRRREYSQHDVTTLTTLSVWKEGRRRRQNGKDTKSVRPVMDTLKKSAVKTFQAFQNEATILFRYKKNDKKRKDNCKSHEEVKFSNASN